MHVRLPLDHTFVLNNTCSDGNRVTALTAIANGLSNDHALVIPDITIVVVFISDPLQSINIFA